MEKRGPSSWAINAVVITLLTIVVISVLMAMLSVDPNANFTGIGKVFIDLVSPLGQGALDLVSRSTLSIDDQMIAFAIAILVSAVGYKSLKLVLSPGISLIVAIMIAIITGRSITSQLIQDSALAAAPLASAFMLVSVVIGLGVIRLIRDKMKFISSLSRFMMYLAFALIYMFYFEWQLGGSRFLGGTVAALFVILGIFEELSPVINKWRKDNELKNLAEVEVERRKHHEDSKKLNKDYIDALDGK